MLIIRIVLDFKNCMISFISINVDEVLGFGLLLFYIFSLFLNVELNWYLNKFYLKISLIK